MATSAWQRERDRLGDLLETVEETVLTDSETRRLIDLLSESAPSTRSRMAASDWDDEVSKLVAELVSASG